MAIGSPSSQHINWKWGKVKHRRPDNSAAVWHISASHVCITALSSVIAGWAGSGDRRRQGGGGGGMADGCEWAVAACFCFTKHSNNVHIINRYLGPFNLIWDFLRPRTSSGEKDTQPTLESIAFFSSKKKKKPSCTRSNSSVAFTGLDLTAGEVWKGMNCSYKIYNGVAVTTVACQIWVQEQHSK